MNPDEILKETGLSTTQVLEQANLAGTEAARVSGQSFTETPLTSEALQQQTPFELTPEAPPTQAAALGGQIEGIVQGADDFIAQTAKQAQEAEAKAESSLQDLIKGLSGAQGETELTDIAFRREGGVDDVTKELNAINQSLKEEELSRRRAVEQREKNLEGTFGGAVAQDVAKINRESYRLQADMAIVQQGIQGRFDSARTIADRAVAVQLEQQQNRIDALQINYEANKDLFNKREQRAFEAQQADRQRKQNNEEFRLRAEYEQKLAQSDPLYKIQVQKARRELALVGQKTKKEIDAENKALLDAQKALPVIENKISLIDGLLDSKAMDSVVGTSFLTRGPGGFLGVLGRLQPLGLPSLIGGTIDTLTGERQSFIGGVEQLIDQEFLDKLIDVKSQGATFGALSNAEGAALRSAATKIGTWRIRKGDDIDGRVIGYNASEAAFKKELETLRRLTQLTYARASGNLFTEEENNFFLGLEAEGVNFNPEY